jgi:hypothetical protein
VLHISFACKVFLDHPQKNIWVSWRGSQPSLVRVSNKTKIKKAKLGLIKTRLDCFFFFLRMIKVKRCNRTSKEKKKKKILTKKRY